MSDGAAANRPRYSERPLPPYSYVPGHSPHPVSDPLGHMHGAAHVSPPALEPERWEQSEAYRYGVDLFNHGFYWEAHEAWESLWHAAGRRGITAVWLKGLIKLAAAAVKVREGNAAGVARHGRRARELLGEVRAQLDGTARSYCGVEFRQVEDVLNGLDTLAARPLTPQPTLLLDDWLRLVP